MTHTAQDTVAKRSLPRRVNIYIYDEERKFSALNFLNCAALRRSLCFGSWFIAGVRACVYAGPYMSTNV